VCLSAYRIDKTEVTVSAYRSCVVAGACTEIALVPDYPRNSHLPDRDDHPVVGSTWEQADTYCRWAGKRLPTEAEWERAALGPMPDRRPFVWGYGYSGCDKAVIEVDRRQFHEGCKADQPEREPFTRPVCSRPRGHTPEGICDMAGNAGEWVSDWFLRSSTTTGGAGKNPRGPCAGRKVCPGARGHVIKGGGWSLSSLFLPIYTRLPTWKPFIPALAGFRCAATESTR
jgi:formylglycine-generating enzyme required for sulfatase activity